MKLRIAMVGACPYPVPQGSQVLLRTTAEAVRDRGHEVHLVVYGYGTGDEHSKLPVHRCPKLPVARKTSAGPSLAKPVVDALLVGTLRRVVRLHNIDLVHVHNYEALFVALAARTRPLVYHAHNAMIDELPHFFGGSRLAQAVGRWLDRTFPRRADHVIAPHAGLAEYALACGCRPGRVSIVPPPAEISRFEPGDTTGGTPPVLYTGNLDPYQNLELLKRVMQCVRSNVPSAGLVVATAQRGAVEGAEVISTPDFEALQNVLARDAVVVCPRISWSGYPIKLVNAMAAGKAIVACRSAAHPLTDEHDGLVVPDNDEKAFATAICRLLRDPDLRRKLGKNARETAVTRHDPSAIAAELEQVYAKVLRARQIALST